MYCLKFVLRGESPRDYADMLRSLRFPPSVSICDIPERLARHVNNALPGFFSPHDGMLFSLTEDNLQAAEQGLLTKSVPWVHEERAITTTNSGITPNEGYHPITGVSDRYCLFDRFHEKNSSQRSSLLRRVSLVPELNGLINTEAQEQLHSLIGRSNYCLNTMKPSTHLFMMRLKIHHHNKDINDVFRSKIEKTFSAQAGQQVETSLDVHGRLVLKRRHVSILRNECDPKTDCPATSRLENPTVSVVPDSPTENKGSSSEFDLPMSPVIPVSASRVKLSSTDSINAKHPVGISNQTIKSPASSLPGNESSRVRTPQVTMSGSKNLKVNESMRMSSQK